MDGIPNILKVSVDQIITIGESRLKSELHANVYTDKIKCWLKKSMTTTEWHCMTIAIWISLICLFIANKVWKNDYSENNAINRLIKGKREEGKYRQKHTTLWSLTLKWQCSPW